MGQLHEQDLVATLPPRCQLHYYPLLSACIVGITLDEAIRNHLENERKYLHPSNNEAFLRHKRRHVRIFETAPRVSKMIERRIAIRKNEKEQTMNTFKTDELTSEIQALQRLLLMVRMSENGESLDEMAC
jgi:hypothetical protein